MILVDIGLSVHRHVRAPDVFFIANVPESKPKNQRITEHSLSIN